MNKALKKYLEDIVLSIDAIEVHVKDIHQLFDYENNIKLEMR